LTTNYCLPCHQICYTCTGPLTTQCTACDSVNQHRLISDHNTCECQPQHYYDNNVSIICPACSYTCLTCDFSSNSSCTSC
jgi:proprotein convertase subtilisin/kexin type 5